MQSAVRLYKHGGARNRADRTSDCLTSAQTQKIIAALWKAEKHSLFMNRHIIVHWEKQGVPDSRAMAATTALLRAFREWTGGETAFVWTRENGDGKGSHLHMLAHIPIGRRWEGAITRRWLERISGNSYKRGAIKTRCIAGYKSVKSCHYAANLQTVAAYILKGVSPDTAAALGIAHEPGGRIIGKRCGTSRNIST